MNVLKKSTLALAIAGFASAASAATITLAENDAYYGETGQWVLSNQGIEVGKYHSDVLAFDLKVVNAHESRSEFDIVLPETVSLEDLTAATAAHPIASSGSLTLFENNGAGQDNNKYYINGSDLADSAIAIRVGTGSFSVESYKFDSASNTLTLISGVGQSLLPGSSIGIAIGNATDGVRLEGAADITVKTYTDAREFIEQADAKIATTGDQFELALREGTSELVDRVDQSYFATEVFYNDDKVETSAAGKEDANVYELYRTSTEGVIRITNDAELVAKANLDSAVITLDGNFAKAFLGKQDYFSFTNDAYVVTGVATTDTANPTFTFDLVANNINENLVTEYDMRMKFVNPDDATQVADLQNAFDIAAKLVYSDKDLVNPVAGNLNTSDKVTLDKTAFGEWVLDQAIINVPYMPVGYKAKGIDAVFEIANRGWADAAIKVKGFDQYGNVFPATALVDAGKIENNGVAAAQTIVKVSADDILATFGLEEGDQRKMNITFMIDANRADIDLVPYYNNNGGRTPIMNSQYKDGAERR